MAASLVAGAALGAVFGKLLQAALDAKDRASEFQTTLASLARTLEAIDPLIREMEQQNFGLNRPEEALKSLIRDLEEGTQLVYKCSNISRADIIRRRRYQKKLATLAESLERQVRDVMRDQNTRDDRETLLRVRNIEDILANELHLSRTGSSSHNSAEQAMEDITSHSQIQSRHSVEPPGMSLDARGNRQSSMGRLSRGRRSVDSSGIRF